MTIPAGAVLDPYDDDFGSLKGFFRSDRAPEFIKTAEVMSEQELQALPDHAFAVVLMGRGKQLRKYACTDKAHTAVNVLYFLENANRFPPMARIKTASNLRAACVHFELQPPPALTKIAIEKKRLIKSDGAEIRMPKRKEADLTGSKLMSVSAPPNRAKLSSFMSNPYMDLDEVDYSIAKQAAEQSMCALSDGRLPLYSYTQVEDARRYFEETSGSMHPRTRHELCVKLASRADQLGAEVPSVVRKYGSTEWAPEGEMQATLQTRRQVWASLDNNEGPGLLDLLMEKKASLKPDVFAEALAEIDAQTRIDHYWDRGVVDPWLTTFGVQKRASGWAWESGDVKISEGELKKLADSGLLKEKFGEAMAEGLAENPTVVFDSLPLDTQRVIAAMARREESWL